MTGPRPTTARGVPAPRLVSLLAVAAAFLATFASAADVEQNYTLSDVSSMVSYEPATLTTPDAGWNGTYSNTTWGNWTDAAMGDGASGHVTAFSGATVTVPFYGTAAYFSGDGDSGAKVSLSVDGKEAGAGSVAAETGVVASATGLDNGYHKAVLKVEGGGTFTFRSVLLTTVIGGEGTKPLNQTFLSVANDALNPALQLGGEWTDTNTVCGDGAEGADSVTCYSALQAFTATAGNTVTLQPPNGAANVMIYGSVGVQYADYSVTLDPAPPVGEAVTQLTSKRSYRDVMIVLYQATLDPTVKYTLTVQLNDSFDWGFARAQYIVGSSYTKPFSGPLAAGATGDDKDGSSGSTGGTGSGKSNSSNSTSVPMGAIIGAAVGGGLGAVALGLLIWWCCRRQRGSSGRGGRWKAKRPTSVLSAFEVDNLGDSPKEGKYSTLADGEVTPLPAPWPAGQPGYGQPGFSGQPGFTPAQGYPAQQGAYHGTAAHAKMQEAQHLSQQAAYPTPLSTQTHNTSSNGYTSTYASPITPMGSGASGAPFSFARAETDGTFGYAGSQAGSSSAASAGAGAALAGPMSPVAAKGQQAYVPPGTVTESQDAGRVQDEVIPPRYNPKWADE